MQENPEASLFIASVYRDLARRDTASLQSFYSDETALRKVVHDVGSRQLTPERICNKRLLLKPNWVKHNHYPDDPWCLRTHDAFLLAVLEYLLRLKPASVLIGDAPIQGCRWEDMVSHGLIKSIEALSHKYQVPVQVKDFRRTVFQPGSNKREQEVNPIADYLLFDVGSRSYFESVMREGKNLFRVSQYDPDRLRESHRPGVHRYCITKALFDAEVVVSLPKVKTHQKSGITAALKNIVGLNGDKDFLPHHRRGGSDAGGDSYRGRNLLRHWSELALDQANRRRTAKGYVFWRRAASLLWKISLPDKRFHQPNGAWFGNDTTWRMVMDLNLIVHFGRADGTLADRPQRLLYHFCDGIVAGEGDGPLHPEPLPLGVVLLSDSAALLDHCAAVLMGMQPSRIPLLQAAQAWLKGTHTRIELNGALVDEQDLHPLALVAKMPPGWAGYAA
jgi:uncharacterized protein (DUF362 family)